MRHGHRGVFIRPSAYVDDLPLSHPVYDPFWAAVQDLDVPVALHPGVHVDTPGACRKFGLIRQTESMTLSNLGWDGVHGGSALGQAVGNTVDMIVSIGRIIMGGVCERFPRLRFVFLEAGGGWLPTQLERMDEQVEAFPMEARWLYDATERVLPAAVLHQLRSRRVEPRRLCRADRSRPHHVGVGLPHPEYDPEALATLARGTAGLGDEDRRWIVGGTAIQAYGLPL